MLKTTMPQIAEKIEGYLCCSRGKSYITEHCLLWKFSITKVSIIKGFPGIKFLQGFEYECRL